MHEVIIGLMFTALIPVVVYLVYKPSLNLFFKLLLASILLSIFFDALSTTAAIYYRNNLALGCIYCILNTLIITLLWQKVPFYSIKIKMSIRNIGYTLIAIMILLNIYFTCTIGALYMLSCLNVFWALILSLLYYYQKIKRASYTPLLQDPYYITATGVLLFSLSTNIILAAQIHLGEQPDIVYTWILRQAFYFIYNIIIGYAFYVLYKTQSIK